MTERKTAPKADARMFLSVFYTDAVGISTLAVSMIPMLLITLNKKKADANEQTLRERREAGISE